mmetsp:Transcript_7140/g.21030  ORF Transcript_7140/g.21030 Transcript_7140/m.21030 type:complete len:118 (-) Transcript_7140:14-367(-)
MGRIGGVVGRYIRSVFEHVSAQALSRNTASRAHRAGEQWSWKRFFSYYFSFTVFAGSAIATNQPSRPAKVVEEAVESAEEAGDTVRVQSRRETQSQGAQKLMALFDQPDEGGLKKAC